MSRELAKRYCAIKQKLEELHRARMKHLDACHKITGQENKLREEVKSIEPEVLEWHEKELIALGIRNPPNSVISGLPDSAYSPGNPPIATAFDNSPAIPAPNKPKDGTEIPLTIPGCDGVDMMPVVEPS